MEISIGQFLPFPADLFFVHIELIFVHFTE